VITPATLSDRVVNFAQPDSETTHSGDAGLGALAAAGDGTRAHVDMLGPVLVELARRLSVTLDR
jgi:hypothetical protein